MDLKEEEQKVEKLLKEIKNKAEIIESQTKHLRLFNAKLEILLKCFEAYSFEEISKKENITNKLKNNVDFKDTNDLKNKLKDINDLKDSTDLQDKTINEENIKKLKISKNNALAMSIFELIKENEPISLDNIVKSIKHSKYKIIEILNEFIKERIIIKKFEKEFVYRINK